MDGWDEVDFLIKSSEDYQRTQSTESDFGCLEERECQNRRVRVRVYYAMQAVLQVLDPRIVGAVVVGLVEVVEVV